MNKKILFSVVFVGTFICAPISVALATAESNTNEGTTTQSTTTVQTNADAVRPLSQVLESLGSSGYRVLNTIELDNGVYKAKVITKMGNEVKLEINAKTGKIVKPNPNDEKNTEPKLSLLDIVKKVEANGYHQINKVKCDDKECTVKALNSKGDSEKLTVDANTGEIKKSLF